MEIKDNINKHETNNRNIYELRDELSNQKLTNQLFLCKGKIDLVGELVDTIVPNTDIKECENYLESIDENYDHGPLTVQKADIFIEKGKKIFNNVIPSDYDKRNKNFDIKVIRYLGRNRYIAGERVNCFFNSISY